MGNIKYTEEYLNLLKKKGFKSTNNLKIQENLDDSLVQVIPNQKEAEKNKQYNNLILANKTGIKFDENQVKQYIINPQKNYLNVKQVREVDKYDTVHRGNPQYVTDYVDDIVTSFKETELLNCPMTDYMKYQGDVSPRMRAILIDWMIEVSLCRFNLGSFEV